jgi:hypothetical protein
MKFIFDFTAFTGEALPLASRNVMFNYSCVTWTEKMRTSVRSRRVLLMMALADVSHME